jgi:hypothetical protein
MSSCLAKPKKWHSMVIESKFIGSLHALQFWKHIHWAFRYMNRLNMYWTLLNACECLNANEWVLNTPWTPIECARMPLSHYWTRLTMVWPWERSHLCQNWTHPEHLWVQVNANEWVLNSPWTPIECAWMPLSMYLDGLNAHLYDDQFNKFMGPVQLESLNIGINWDLMLTVKKTCIPFSNYCQDMYGTSVLLLYTSTCKKIVWKTSGLQKYDVLSD